MITAIKDKAATARVIAIFRQTGTSNPQIDDYVNTLGSISMNRIAPGQYNIIAPGPWFKENYTRINDSIDGATPLLLSIAAINDHFVQFAWLSTNTITVDVKNAAGVRVELSSLAGGTLHIPLKIEIYNYTIASDN